MADSCKWVQTDLVLIIQSTWLTSWVWNSCVFTMLHFYKLLQMGHWSRLLPSSLCYLTHSLWGRKDLTCKCYEQQQQQGMYWWYGSNDWLGNVLFSLGIFFFAPTLSHDDYFFFKKRRSRDHNVFPSHTKWLPSGALEFNEYCNCENGFNWYIWK